MQNLLTANHRKNGESKYDRKLYSQNRCRDYMNPVPCKRGAQRQFFGTVSMYI